MKPALVMLSAVPLLLLGAYATGERAESAQNAAMAELARLELRQAIAEESRRKFLR